MLIQISGGGYMSNKIIEVQNIKVNIIHIELDIKEDKSFLIRFYYHFL